MNNKKALEKNLIRSRNLAILSTLLLVAMILFPLFSSAKSPVVKKKEATVYMHAFKASKKASVTLHNFEEGKYNLTIEGASGVYYDALVESADGFAKVFDLNNLEDGQYTLKVKNRSDEQIRHFTIENNEIKVFYKEQVNPFFQSQGEKAMLILPNTYGNKVAIKILNNNGEVLYNTYESKDTIRKVFNFSSS